MLQMAVVLTFAGRKPVVKVGRIAEASSPSRCSSQIEQIGDVTPLPSYRGDIINGMEFEEAARTPDPERLLEGLRAILLDLEPDPRAGGRRLRGPL